MPAVRSAHVHESDRAVTVWIDVADDSDAVRNSVYHLEDEIAINFPQARIAFQIIPVPEGRRIQDFVSAECVYARRA
jgi:hypothetical protein